MRLMFVTCSSNCNDDILNTNLIYIYRISRFVNLSCDMNEIMWTCINKLIRVMLFVFQLISRLVESKQI